MCRIPFHSSCIMDLSEYNFTLVAIMHCENRYYKTTISINTMTLPPPSWSRPPSLPQCALLHHCHGHYHHHLHHLLYHIISSFYFHCYHFDLRAAIIVNVACVAGGFKRGKLWGAQWERSKNIVRRGREKLGTRWENPRAVLYILRLSNCRDVVAIISLAINPQPLIRVYSECYIIIIFIITLTIRTTTIIIIFIIFIYCIRPGTGTYLYQV